MLQIDKATLHNFSEAVEFEWLETNGLGGWSSSSVIGCNTRRYHGLLVAATIPPTERMVLVSKLDETIIAGNERFELGSNNYGTTVHPLGYQYMTGFSRGLFPEFVYEAGGITLKKTIAMVHRENTVLIMYQVIKARAACTMELLPLLSVRNYHGMVHSNDAVNHEASFRNHVFCTKAYQDTPDIFMKIPGADFHAGAQWFYNFNYSAEQFRGLDFTEDLFNHGKFIIPLHQDDVFGIILSTEDPSGRDALELFQQEENRKKNLLRGQAFNHSVEQHLTLAADQFIVERNIPAFSGLLRQGATVIAGYHWFTDWSRDTMISLPGLTLSTGRYEDAKKILAAFACSVSMGMLPNRFMDNGGAPEYNNADGTLWYFVAVYKYLNASNDKSFVLNKILPVLKDIICWHYKGTRYNIHVTEDELLYAGEAGQQLTWMDAKCGDWVVTPHGETGRDTGTMVQCVKNIC